MKAQRKIRFKMINKNGQIDELEVTSKEAFVIIAAAIKKSGGKIIKSSIKVSASIVMGNTTIVKKCA